MRSSSLLLCLCILLMCLPLSLASLLPSVPIFSHASAYYNRFTSLFTPSPIYRPTPSSVLSYLRYDPTLRGSAHIVDVRASLLRALQHQSSSWLSLAQDIAPPSSPSSDATTYPYWRMIPAYITSLIPADPANTFSSPCFAHVSATVTRSSSTSYTLSITNRDATSRDCSDSYLIATVEGLKLHTFTCLSPFRFLCNQHEDIVWEADNATTAELFDVDSKGFRVFRFQDDTVQTLKDLDATLTLFTPLLTAQVSEEAAAANIDFLAHYANVTVEPRSVQHVPVDAKLIRSGDFFGVLRLDGLDPMLAWAMGSVTGHTVLALWMDTPRQLYIVESTNNNSYWPVNGVQRTLYADWLQRASNASYNVVWAPLSAEAALAFNETAAAEYFFTQEGYDYGYYNLLWGWQDTVSDNYPCLPPAFELCLTPHHVQILFGFIDRSIPTVGDILFIQAWNKRLGTQGLNFAELLQHANQTAKLSAEELPLIVERDDWVYDTQRYGQPAQGPAQVCCTFVCNIWKSGGLFGNLSDSIFCAEQTNFDDYSLDLLTTPQQRPSQCVTADPSNVLCQLEGAYSVELGPEYGSRAPYAHMDEKCPSLAPSYSRPSNC